MSINIRGYVYSKYKSVFDFADDMGWSHSKASRIVNGQQEPTASEMADIAGKFEMGSKEFISLFFPKLSTKWTE